MFWDIAAKAPSVEISADASTIEGTGVARGLHAVAPGDVAAWDLELSPDLDPCRYFLGIVTDDFDGWKKYADQKAYFFEKDKIFIKGSKSGNSSGSAHYFKAGDTVSLRLDRSGVSGVLTMSVGGVEKARIDGLPAEGNLYPAAGKGPGTGSIKAAGVSGEDEPPTDAQVSNRI